MKFLRQLWESLRFAAQALQSNLLRTTLSLLGVTVGIFSIIAVFTLVDSLESGIRQALNFAGSNTLMISKWSWNFTDPDYAWWDYFKRPNLTYGDYRFLERNLENAQAIAISDGRGNQTARYLNNSMTLTVGGITADFPQISDLPIEQGRFFSPQESEAARNVLIIGADVAENLFSGQEPVGKFIKLKGLNFMVVGVIKRVGNSMVQFAGNPDTRCYMPYLAYAKLYQTRNSQPTISLKGYDTDPSQKELEAEITGLLRARRGLKPTQPDNFSINRPEAIQDIVGNIFKTLTFAGWMIGLFSLLIGGFGIANIMFVSVRERTSLIGIQKSLGAKTYFILFQFLFEAMFLSLIGGLVGIGLVWLLTFYPQDTLEVSMTLPNVLLGLVVSSLIGILSGLIPAWVAARLDPVTAIRAK